MPTIFSHAIVASAVGQWWRSRHLPANFWTWTVACSMLPDIDVIGFSFGIPYDDMFGHRGFTHSLFFAAVVAAVAASRVRRLHEPGSTLHRPGSTLHRPGSTSHQPG